MKIRAGRIALIAIAAEVLGLLALVLVVALFGPSDKAAVQAYAERLGLWVGPISGLVFCFIGGILVARGLAESHVLNGLLLGLVAAGLDIGIVVLAGSLFPLQTIFVLANIGRILAGTIGGWFATRFSRASALTT